TGEEMLGRLHRALESDIPLVRMETVPAAATFEPVAVAPDDGAQITYTSGSTGLPKGVLASHANVVAAIGTVAEYLGLNEDDRIGSVLPFSSVYGANQLLCALMVGAELYVER